MIDVTAESIPIVREQAAVPIIAKVAAPKTIHADQLFAARVQWATFRRGAIMMRYALVEDERPAPVETHSEELGRV